MKKLWLIPLGILTAAIFVVCVVLIIRFATQPGPAGNSIPAQATSPSALPSALPFPSPTPPASSASPVPSQPTAGPSATPTPTLTPDAEEEIGGNEAPSVLSEDEIITGTITAGGTNTLTIKTDDGKTYAFIIGNADLSQAGNMYIGDKVTIYYVGALNSTNSPSAVRIVAE